MNKVWKKICLLSLVFVLVGLMFSFTNVLVIAEGEEPIPDGQGGYIKYYQSDENVTYQKYEAKDTEFRAVWVSPLVSDIPYYSSKIQYQKEMLEVLDNMEAYGLNVMLYHVRIMNDALYESKYCAWSKYYNTNPDWDCLPWLIEECHKRGIEFHAWMNPYRVQNGTYDLTELAKNYQSNNMASKASNLLQGTNSVILNPGIPEVREWLVKVCMEVVENYNVDAIHFDDYFYDAGVDDSATRAIYNTTGMSLDNWRREQVNIFIKNLSNAIRTYNTENNKCVQLGISPSGVWKADSTGKGIVTYNESTGMVSSNGSRTASASFQHYGNYLYSDTFYWINMEWIDYIIPQTYWAMNHPSCPYADLMEWWNEVCSYKNVNLYSGLGLYLKDSSGGYGWYTNIKEAYNQIRFCNQLDDVRGFCFFAYSDIKDAIKSPIITSGVKTLFSNRAILPEIRTQAKFEVEAPKDLSVSKTDAGYKLSFKQDDDAKFYVIYRSEEEITYSPEEVIDIIGDISIDGVIEYIDEKASTRNNYNYAVKEQSYSLALGPSSTVSTENAEAGSLVNLGDINDFGISVAGTKVTIYFGLFSYPYGSDLAYEVEYQLDDNSSVKVTSFTTKKSFYYTDVNITNDIKEIKAKLTISNSVGQTEKEIKYSFVSSLPSIKNFTIEGEMYNGARVQFIWNNQNIDDATYIIQESTDGLVWDDLQIVNPTTTRFNVRERITLSDKVGDIYYRVQLVSNGEFSYSDVIKKNVYSNLGSISNVKFDNETLDGNVYSAYDGDKLTITWRAQSNANYTVNVSTDGINWYILSAYEPMSRVNVEGNVGTAIIPINYKAFHLRLQIEAKSGVNMGYSEVYDIYVTIEDLYCDEVINYLNQEYNLFIEGMGIYR